MMSCQHAKPCDLTRGKWRGERWDGEGTCRYIKNKPCLTVPQPCSKKLVWPGIWFWREKQHLCPENLDNKLLCRKGEHKIFSPMNSILSGRAWFNKLRACHHLSSCKAGRMEGPRAYTYTYTYQYSYPSLASTPSPLAPSPSERWPCPGPSAQHTPPSCLHTWRCCEWSCLDTGPVAEVLGPPGVAAACVGVGRAELLSWLSCEPALVWRPPNPGAPAPVWGSAERSSWTEMCPWTWRLSLKPGLKWHKRVLLSQ